MRKTDQTYFKYCSSCAYCGKRVKDSVKCKYYRAWVRLTFDKCPEYFNPNKTVKKVRTHYLLLIALGIIMMAFVMGYAAVKSGNLF